MASPAFRASGRIAAWAVALCVAGLFGCGPKNHPQPTTQSAKPPGQAPLAGDLLKRHNDQVAALKSLSATGVVELRWTDESGGHFEQGEMDLWLVMPWQLALRIHKLGEDFLWLGASEQNFWLFDLRNRDQAVLHVGSHQQGETDESAPLKVKPLVLLDLCAMTQLSLPEGAPDAAALFDNAQNAWVVPATGRGGPVRVFFDARSSLPIRIEAVGGDGQTALFSRIAPARFAPVEIPGVSAGSYPRIPTLIDLLDPQSKDEVKIAIDEQSLSYRDQQQPPNPRVFDLQLLIKRFQPARIEGELPASTAQR